LTKETEGQYLTDRLADEAAKAIRASSAQPFFLYLPTYQVHMPIQPKPEYVTVYEQRIKPGMKHANAKYAAMVQSLDELVGKVLDTLDELGIVDRTVVFFTSDNGGLSHVWGLKGGPTNNTPLRAGKGSAYEGGVRVPLIVRWPGAVRPGTTCEEPVLSIDYYKTILEITGATGDPTHNADVDGVSLAPLLKDPSAQLPREAIYWHYPHYHPGGATPYGAIRSRDWKLIEYYEDNRVELYNLINDLSEKKNMAAAMPEKAKDLRNRLHAWRASVGAQMPTINPDSGNAGSPSQRARGARRLLPAARAGR
jgi:arylsulfatase A-like enzyme